MNKKYTSALVGESLDEKSKEKLSSYGYKVFTLPKNTALSDAVSHHPDLSVLPLYGRIFLSSKYYKENKALLDEISNFTSLPLCLTEEHPASPYPDEAIFCALPIGERKLLANKKTLSVSVLAFCEREKIEILHTNQGYARCTSLYFKNRLISADPSSLLAAKSASLETLKISRGGIELLGYDYGFIGGSSGFDGEKIFFTGDVSSHPNGEKIIAFAKSAECEAISLSEGHLTDVGGIIFI